MMRRTDCAVVMIILAAYDEKLDVMAIYESVQPLNTCADIVLTIV